MSINPLSNPKGLKLTCELCSKPAYIQCKSCRVTYYCGKDHQIADFRGIHEKICQLLIPLRTSFALLGSEEERKHRAIQKRLRLQQLYEITKSEAERKLHEGYNEMTIPAALQALKASLQLSGENSLEQVPSYLLLGEASIGLKKTDQAEQYLSMAKWAVMRNDSSDYYILAKLSHNFGLLHASKAEYKLALKYFAEEIYYCSLVNTPPVKLCSGFFHLGNVLLEEGNDATALAIYKHVIDLYINERKLQRKQEVTEKVESIQILQTMRKVLVNQPGKDKKDKIISLVDDLLATMNHNN